MTPIEQISSAVINWLMILPVPVLLGLTGTSVVFLAVALTNMFAHDTSADDIVKFG